MFTPGRAIDAFRSTSKFARLRGFARDERGVTAVEFSQVAVPFFMFIFTLFTSCLYFFVVSSLENGMDQTTRLIRTGEAVTDKLTVDQFKEKVCDGAGTMVDCNKMQVWAEHFGDWSAPGLKPHQCVDSTTNTMIINSAKGSDPIATYSGSASDVVIVTVCYKWDFASKLAFFKLGNMSDGSMIMQTSTAFRTEPYPVSGS